MAKTTKPTANVTALINSFVEREERRKDSFELLNLMQDLTGYEPKM